MGAPASLLAVPAPIPLVWESVNRSASKGLSELQLTRRKISVVFEIDRASGQNFHLYAVERVGKYLQLQLDVVDGTFIQSI